ncbi:MAG: type II toxin-antitoxin system RelE/ParE family toxin [Candidatus Azobacteroides sp.]|nr:type II toxin-antitoxin system RelE/ParE family toxin [Candidatus Azobacteroides sp.]
MNIVFSDLAFEQLESIYNYLQTKSNCAGTIIHNYILDEIERLRNFPQMAPIESELIGFVHTYRSLVVKKTYKIVYYIENDTVYIAALFDCRQDPQKLKDNFQH